jgi:2-dehydro-3-deoxygluconokinase
VKLGDQGAAVLADGTWHMQDAVPVDVVDTVGAGDAFAAGYIAERIYGGSVSASLRLATMTGAAACAHPGDWEGIPFRRDLESDTGIHVVDR